MIETSISEKFSKKKGRPKLFSDDIATCLNQYNENSTARTVQNRFYKMQFTSLVLDDPEKQKRYEWLMGGTDFNNDKPKSSILYQLGRLAVHGDGCMFVFADELCRIKPKTKDAIILIRKWQAAMRAA